MKRQRLYFHDILERIGMIEEFTEDGREAFMESVLIQEGVIRCFEVIGEIVKRLSPEATAGYPHIPWRRIAGFRDILIHDYDEIDIEVVWRVVEDDLAPLKQAIEAMSQEADRSDVDNNSI